MKIWIARDPDGALCLHKEKPCYGNSINAWFSNSWMRIPYNEYPEVTFENSPMEVELVIKK